MHYTGKYHGLDKRCLCASTDSLERQDVDGLTGTGNGEPAAPPLRVATAGLERREVDGSASAAEGEPAAQPLRVATAGLERREVDGSDIYRTQQIRMGF